MVAFFTIHPGFRAFRHLALFSFALVCQLASCDSHAQTISRDWNEQCLSAIRIDTPHPPAQARNLFGLSVCMYDAWTAYTNGPIGYIYRGKHTAADVGAARHEAISYAAYRMLHERYFYSKAASTTLPAYYRRYFSRLPWQQQPGN